MTGMRGDDAMIRRLVRWGAERDDGRAMLLTSTRAVPGGRLDALSDYDVILVVRDGRRLAESIAAGSAISVRCWWRIGTRSSSTPTRAWRHPATWFSTTAC